MHGYCNRLCSKETKYPLFFKCAGCRAVAHHFGRTENPRLQYREFATAVDATAAAVVVVVAVSVAASNSTQKKYICIY